MAQLTGNAIQSSYLGLLKTLDNAAMSNAGFPQITDGAGNNSMLKMSQTELQLGSNINTQYFKQYATGATEIKDAAFSIYDATSSQYVIVDATNAGVGSGANYFLATAAGSSIAGPLDLSGATITGLPVDPNTTYDLAAVASGANINLNLTGSDATTDTVSIVAGTNITLSEAAGVVTIDAAGGGGGTAGLESGTGTDSMQSSSALTTVAADASAEATIALGDGAIASSSNNIAIGNTANAGGDDAFARGNIAIGNDTDATNEKDVAIGNSAQATGSRTVAIGDGATASGSRSVVVGASSLASAFSSCVFGAFSEATAEGATVVGGYGSSATQTDAIAVGKEADALAAGAIAIGKLAQATATDAIALGKDVTGNIASTVSAKALELQTDSTPTAGGIIMSDAGATDRRLNITTDGALQLDDRIPVDVPANGDGGNRIPFTSYGTATYWHACPTIYGRPSISTPAVDQGANELLITRFDINSTNTVTTFGIPMEVVGNDTLYIGVYEQDTTTGGPGALVKSMTQAVTASDNNTWVEVTPATTFTPEVGKSYWIGCMTLLGNTVAGLGYVGGEAAAFQRFTTTNNSSVGTVLGINTLFTGTSGSLPSNLVSATFGHRDELAFYAWK